MYTINKEQLDHINELIHNTSHVYPDLDVIKTFDYFTRKYINPLNHFIKINENKLVDCGCGNGWFALTYILNGGKYAVASDPDKNRIDFGQKIAAILGIEDKIEFINYGVGDLPFEENSVDIFVSIETMEHVGKKNIASSLKKIYSMTKKAILITTPNGLFPVIAHDTELPFIHWLSPKMRKPLTRLLGHSDTDFGNNFLTPFHFRMFFDKFKVVSKCLSFPEYSDFVNFHPYYLPYGYVDSKRYINRPNKLKALYYKMVSSILQSDSFWIMPSISFIMMNKKLSD